MNKVYNLQDLVSRTQQDLEEILGNDVSAKLLWNCLHTKPLSSAATSETKNPQKNAKNKRKK